MADFRSSVSNQPSGGADGGMDGLEETLGRLAKKPGVKATIVLDRTSGAILKTSGEISSIRTSRSDPLVTSSFSSENGSSPAGEPQGAEQLAAMVWNFISAAGALVRDLDSEDELRLLRLRTKNQELVIVPDPKYLLIVIHDTPAA